MGSNIFTEFFLNFTNEFSDSFLYAYFLQIILIVYMYKCIGSGKYWKLLLAGSIFGLLGAVIEHVGTALLKTNNNITKIYLCYLLAEIGWITSEFSIPFLNLIKLNTLSQSKLIKTVNYIVGVLFVAFACSRFYIGYLRLVNKVLYDPKIYHAHGIAFSIIAVADGVLSILIFSELNKSVKKTKEKEGETINLLSYFKKSSLFTLLVVDLLSVILAILSIFINDSTTGEAMNKLIKPFHAIKSNFLLILAVDAFIFKLRASVDGSSLVSHYISQHSKLRSNHGEYTDEIPLSSKKYRNKSSSQMLSGNTMTNSNNYSTNYSGNYGNGFGASYSGNHNMNMSSTSHTSNSAKRSKGHTKSHSVSESYYKKMSSMNGSSTDIINSYNKNMDKTNYSSTSSCTLTDSQTTRAYIKGKKLLKAKSIDDSERSNNSSTHSSNAVSITPLTPLHYNGNYVKRKNSSSYMYPSNENSKNNKSSNDTSESNFNSTKSYDKSPSNTYSSVNTIVNRSPMELSEANYNTNKSFEKTSPYLFSPNGSSSNLSSRASSATNYNINKSFEKTSPYLYSKENTSMNQDSKDIPRTNYNIKKNFEKTSPYMYPPNN